MLIIKIYRAIYFEIGGQQMIVVDQKIIRSPENKLADPSGIPHTRRIRLNVRALGHCVSHTSSSTDATQTISVARD